MVLGVIHRSERDRAVGPSRPITRTRVGRHPSTVGQRVSGSHRPVGMNETSKSPTPTPVRPDLTTVSPQS